MPSDLVPLVVRELPPFAVALAVAEFFFKFGSFTLECLAFLALWWVLGRGWRWGLVTAGMADPRAID